MATGNFYPHENGIFAITGESYEDTLEYLKSEYEEDEITDELINDYYHNSQAWAVEDYWERLRQFLPKTLELHVDNMWGSKVYNKQGKLVARLEIRAGYYEHAQVIVHTDPYEIVETQGWYWENNSELYEEYTPHNKRLFKAVEKSTTPLYIKGVFSNGGAVYGTIN